MSQLVTGSERGIYTLVKAVFDDINNVQYPAEVTHILDNPININEALLRPSKNYNHWEND